jgi:hypothetical protein
MAYSRDDPFRVFSFGGGRQSTAVLVLQATGKLPHNYDLMLFANVGQNAERSETLSYFTEYAMPYAEEHSVSLKEVQRKHRDGSNYDLYDELLRDTRSVPIPVYMEGGAPGRRSCTTDYKIAVIDRTIRILDISHAVVGLGISADETERMKDESWTDVKPGIREEKLGFWKRVDYPLVDLRYSLQDCVKIITDAGLPLPPKSACWFCPFKSRNEWIRMRQHEPELFAKAVALEKRLNEKRGAMLRDNIFLHSSSKPLEQAVAIQRGLFDDETNDECGGFCHT